jgi:ferredoxin-NADP reductase
MMITGIKSRPVYATLTPSAEGVRHFVVGQGSGGGPMVRLLNEMTSEQRASTTVLYSTASFTGQNHLAAIQSTGVSDVIAFADNEQAVQGLISALDAATMGTRLYLAGSESFIGTAMQVAHRYDLDNDEVQREHAGSLTRRVWCAHCDTYTEDVTRRVFTCSGCQLSLVVRDHYSSRLAAFQGVKADGEVPGDMPEAEELDT